MRACLLLLHVALTLAQNDAWKNQYPESWKDDNAESSLTFQRIWVWYKFTDNVGNQNKDLYRSCKEVTGTPPVVTYHVHHPKFNSAYAHVKKAFPIEKNDDTQYRIDGSFECCSSKCPGAYNVKVLTLDIMLMKFGQSKMIHQEKCSICLKADAGPRNCTNGQYASEFLKLDQDGMVINTAKCLPCPAGTWMTCAEKSTCVWPIPLSLSDYNPGRDFWMPKSPSGNYYVPVGTCLPCETAGASKSHYGDDPSKASFIQATPSYEFTSTPPNSRTIGLPWSCPGGAQAPRMCSVSDTHGDPLTSAQCVCKAGFAVTVSNTCVICPRGSQCRRGFAEPCPDHSHQPNTGQTDCVNCTSDGTERGDPVTYCGLGGQLRKCISIYKAAQLQCVNCNQCRKMYLPNNAGGKVDCYN